MRKSLSLVLVVAAAAGMSAQQTGVIAYHATGTGVTEIAPVRTDVPNLPDRLIIPPGEYVFQGNTYRLEAPGLYRFLKIDGANEQRIVHNGDVHALLSGLAWLHMHGTTDEKFGLDALEKLAMRRKIVLTCGAITGMADRIVKRLGFDSRMVGTLAAPPYNSYDNGHTLLEVYRTDLHRWVAYDIDNNAYYEHDSVPLSGAELAQYVVTGDYTIVPLAVDSKFVPRTNFEVYDYAFYTEFIAGTEASFRSWLSRVVRVVLIEHEKKFYFSNDELRKFVEAYSPGYKYLKSDEFTRRFYGPPGPPAQEQAKR